MDGRTALAFLSVHIDIFIYIYIYVSMCYIAVNWSLVDKKHVDVILSSIEDDTKLPEHGNIYIYMNKMFIRINTTYMIG